MATIKPIEGSSVHQIQSGQVIVDLCSVVKELVENALDASATSLEIRFKNNGLDSIEVSDNGAGISPDDFDSIALKHYTSKLAKYDDLSSLTTFGFRGEALSSLCALSKLYVVTSRASDAPKGTKLEFEISGRVKDKSVVASQKGTTVTVENIFRNLPVRRRELEKNIKKEYGKVLGLLHAYACISTGVRFSVTNVPSKGKKVVVFSTKSNPTTRENIANVYGAKTLLALIPLDLELELQSTAASTQVTTKRGVKSDTEPKDVKLRGHISRPVVGEGRQTPDRQMFFVNSRPCALPQVSKAINEVYKSYNITQSPFIFANLELDTNAYDVNVSPDKRTILLHDQTALLEALKSSLVELFESQDQRVPQAATPSVKKLPLFKSLLVTPLSRTPDKAAGEPEEESSSQSDSGALPSNSIIRRTAERDLESRENVTKVAMAALAEKRRRETRKATDESPSTETRKTGVATGTTKATENQAEEAQVNSSRLTRQIRDFNARMGVELPADDDEEEELEDSPAQDSSDDETDKSKEKEQATTREEHIPSVSNTPRKLPSGIVPNAFDRMRPKRPPQDVATVTIGNQTTSMTLGTPEAKRRRIHTPRLGANSNWNSSASSGFRSGLQLFNAGGASPDEDDGIEDEEEPKQPTPVTIRSTRRINTEPIDAGIPSKTGIAPTDSEMLEATDGSAENDKDRAPQKDRTPFLTAPVDGSDDEYMDESEKKTREEARIAKMIEDAEEQAARPTSDNVKRAANALKSRIKKDSTLHLMQHLETSVQRVDQGLKQLTKAMHEYATDKALSKESGSADEATFSAEERLALTVSKADFGHMRIIGQFNLGFVLATRTGDPSMNASSAHKSAKADAAHDELFIIDQHASDEKYNFERLQSQTVVQNQRLVHPKVLDLTAIEEEIILNNPDALSKNGFEIEVDTSGDMPVGQRCKLTSLPMSREVTFTLSDLEELLALLSEHPSGDVPRPSKVRKMFAMRACRSSIMVGKTLTHKQMEKVVRHMGELDKPWNCPHGRPTMRHLVSLDAFEPWQEGSGLVGMQDAEEEKVNWAEYLREGKEMGLLDDAIEGTSEDEEDVEEDGEEDAEEDAEDEDIAL